MVEDKKCEMSLRSVELLKIKYKNMKYEIFKTTTDLMQQETLMKTII